MVQHAYNTQNEKVSSVKKAPKKKGNSPKLPGTLASVFIVLGAIAVIWIAMFITYSSRL